MKHTADHEEPEVYFWHDGRGWCCGSSPDGDEGAEYANCGPYHSLADAWDEYSRPFDEERRVLPMDFPYWTLRRRDPKREVA